MVHLLLSEDYAAAWSAPGKKTVLLASVIADLSGQD